MSETERITTVIRRGADTGLSEKAFLEREIARWEGSPGRLEQIAGEMYYQGYHDILRRKRMAIGEDGQLMEVKNLPNNRILDNQYAKAVDQKANYILGKPLALDTENKDYSLALGKLLDRRFQRTLKNVCTDSLNGGIGWLYVYYGDDGELAYMRFPPYQILPFWGDAAHTWLEMAVRVYEVVNVTANTDEIVKKVEVYRSDGISRYVFEGNMLVPDVIAGEQSSHMSLVDGKAIRPYNWGKTPVIPFKYNDREVPLIRKAKSLQDAINTLMSDFANNMQEDSRNTILVIHNYDGTDLGEFRRNLSTYGAIKVISDSTVKGGVETLQIEVSSENYSVILEALKKALIENAMGFDAKDDRMSDAPNQMNIQSMYSDIDLDANGMETEYQAALESLRWFIDVHLANTGRGDFSGEEVSFIFNRDMMMNEAEIMQTLYQGGLKLSNRTLISQVPWIDDVDAELERIKEEQEEALEGMYKSAFAPIGGEADGGAAQQ